MESRLKTRLLVQAIIRQCESRAVPAMVVRKGDPDAGSLLVKVNSFGNGCQVLTPVTDATGRRGWMLGTGQRRRGRGGGGFIYRTSISV